jgi:hypothetical protein
MASAAHRLRITDLQDYTASQHRRPLPFHHRRENHKSQLYANFYLTTRRNIPEDNHPQLYVAFSRFRAAEDVN